MWAIHGLYLPQILEQIGMPAQASLPLVVVEHGLAIALEPLLGGLSDRTQRRADSRFSFVTVGVIAASALFVAIPLLALIGNVNDVLRWFVLFVLVGWALAMTIFHSPSLALLRRYASGDGLPIANSLITLIVSLVSAPKLLFNQWLLGLGPAITFIVGALVLLGTAALLRAIDAPGISSSYGYKNTWPPYFLLTLTLIPVIGLGVGWGIRMEMDTISKTFQAHLPTVGLDWLIMAIAIGVAILAIPAGLLASFWGTRRTLQLGFTLAIVASVLMVFVPIQAVLYTGVIVLAIALSLISNGAFPFILALVPASRAGLGMGLYLGGIAASTSMFGAFLLKLEAQTATASMLMGAIAFLLAALCVLAVPKSQAI
jgi:MFS family permease